MFDVEWIDPVTVFAVAVVLLAIVGVWWVRRWVDRWWKDTMP